jgi:hypothetical protein
MRVLIAVPWARYTPHFETDLEIIQRHLDDGDEVHVIGCDAELPACDRNPEHLLYRCAFCRGKRRRGLSLLDGRIVPEQLFRLTDKDHREIAAVRTDFPDRESLLDFRIEEFDIGYAVLSTVISFLRDPDPLAAGNREWLENLVVAALAIYRSIQHHLDEGAYDRVYIFNGRFAITRAVLRACASRDVTCLTHERGCDHDHYGTFKNTTTHDIALRHEQMTKLWEETDPEERERVGTLFFTERAEGAEQSWYSFTGRQEEGLLPTDWDTNKENIVIFNSSDDEFVAIGPSWQGPIYGNQTEGVERIVAALDGETNRHLYLRVHPNLAAVDNEQTRAIARLSASHLTVIDADSPISTYSLVKAADKVLAFVSTVGIEAVFWGVPSILAGRSFYRPLQATFNPETHEELVALLKADLEPRPKEPALLYGHYMRSFGEKYRHYRPEGVFEGTFGGARVRPGLLSLAGATLLKGLSPLEKALRKRAVQSSLASLRGDKRR